MGKYCKNGQKSVPLDQSKYNRIKEDIKRRLKGKRWGAYTSGQLVSEYKRKGGRYRCRFGDLNRWFKEGWRDVCTNKPCGRKPGEKRRYPYCRPTRRINGSTPRTFKELSREEIKRRCAKKHRIKGRTLTNFGQKKVQEEGLLDLTSKKSILNLRKQIKGKIKNKKTWVYFVSKGITDIKRISFTLPSKSMKKINKRPGKEFKKYIKQSSGNVTSFYSPSKTLLVIPRKAYINIVDFAQRSTNSEWLSLWRRVSKESKKMKKPFYILTHGHNVNWLHIRLQTKKGLI
jgi:hypothetical protein